MKQDKWFFCQKRFIKIRTYTVVKMLRNSFKWGRPQPLFPIKFWVVEVFWEIYDHYGMRNIRAGSKENPVYSLVTFVHQNKKQRIWKDCVSSKIFYQIILKHAISKASAVTLKIVLSAMALMPWLMNSIS